jgi:uncharacterized membrane protein
MEAGQCARIARHDVLEWVLWLHLIAMAFFVGGQLMLGAVVVAVLGGAEDRGPLRAAARRFGIGTLIAIGVLVITGVAMASHFHRWSESTLQVKLGLVVVVAVLIHAHMRRPELHVLDAATFLVSLAIVWLGIVVAGRGLPSRRPPVPPRPFLRSPPPRPTGRPAPGRPSRTPGPGAPRLPGPRRPPAPRAHRLAG